MGQAAEDGSDGCAGSSTWMSVCKQKQRRAVETQIMAATIHPFTWFPVCLLAAVAVVSLDTPHHRQMSVDFVPTAVRPCAVRYARV